MTKLKYWRVNMTTWPRSKVTKKKKKCAVIRMWRQSIKNIVSVSGDPTKFNITRTRAIKANKNITVKKKRKKSQWMYYQFMSESNLNTNAVFVHAILFYGLCIIKTIRSFRYGNNSTTGRREKNNLSSKWERVLFFFIRSIR